MVEVELIGKTFLDKEKNLLHYYLSFNDLIVSVHYDLEKRKCACVLYPKVCKENSFNKIEVNVKDEYCKRYPYRWQRCKFVDPSLIQQATKKAKESSLVSLDIVTQYSKSAYITQS
jgi:hypothetical protein